MYILIVAQVEEVMSIISYVIDVVLQLLWQIGHNIGRFKITLENNNQNYKKTKLL